MTPLPSLKRCRFCKRKDRDLTVHAQYERGSGLPALVYYTCRPCNTKRIREYRKTPEGKAAIRRTTAKYAKRNPDRVRAWDAVKRAGLRGKVKECSQCGKRGLIHLHHPDPKKKLEVIPLCPLCHKAVHREQAMVS